MSTVQKQTGVGAIPETAMRVRKRNGSLEPVNVEKIIKAVTRCSVGLTQIDPMRVSIKTIGGLYDGSTTKELDQLSIQTAASLIAEEPEYSRLAARLLLGYIDKEVWNQNIHSFSQSVEVGHKLGLISDTVARFVSENSRKLNNALDTEKSDLFDYFGVRTLYDRYLLKDPKSRDVIETTQYFFLRVACGLSQNVAEAIEFYYLLSSHLYMTSSPTLFNSGTRHPQMSSCYLLDSPEDSLDSIYDRYKDVAMLSKFAGGIGLAYHRVRARGSLIRGTNGKSNGIIPWLKTLDSSVAAVNQCFAPDTLIYTAEGTKKIGDIEPGDLVLGISGTYRTVLEKMVYNQQNDRMISLDIDYSAKPISVTAGHPFYAISDSWARQVSTKTSKIYVEEGRLSVGWLEAGKLQKGDYIGQVIPTEVIVVDGFTEDDARMYGILLSCGHMDKESLESGITSSSERTVSFVRSYLDAENISYQERSEGRVSHLQWNCASSTGSAKLRFSYEDIYNKEGKKHISRRLAHLPRPQAFILLRTILVANSSLLHSREAAFHSDSLFLVESLRYQALRFGIPAKVKKNTYSYELLIPAVREIAEIMGCNELKNRNWFEWQGFIFLRLVKIKPVKASASVVDLKVEGDESYMTTSGLAHNGGKRRGACCVYLEPWHADIEEFLELKNNTGDENRRTYNLNLANWIPDVFMRRVESDGLWSLFDPKDVPNFPDLYGKEFEDAYVEAERAGIAIKQVKARDLYAKMMKTLAETGNGWMNFKDSCNSKSNQTGQSHNVIHLSNLCTEIVEVTSLGETAVCNLGSVNLSRHIVDGKLDYELLGKTVRTAIKFLDRVIDINYYPTKEAGISNQRWRPVGLGVMGLQDVFFQLRIAFDSPEAREISKKVQEEIYYNALATSSELAEKLGAHPSFAETKAAKGILQFDLWGVVPEDKERWEPLRERIKKFGLRNSLMLAIAPTATIASIVGCYECIEPQVSNLFKRETLSGDFLQVNRYLVGELKKLGLWNEDMRNQIKMGEGSIQHIDKIPEDLKLIYRTVWEIPMRSLIDMAVDRGAFIDQSQSLNLFIESPNIGKLSSMYMYAWKQGLKTTYYLRSRPASKIAKATVPVSSQVNQSQAVACSLENPESCEACQ